MSPAAVLDRRRAHLDELHRLKHHRDHWRSREAELEDDIAKHTAISRTTRPRRGSRAPSAARYAPATTTSTSRRASAPTRRALRDRVLPALGHYKLSDVHRRDVQELVDRWLADGLDPSTIKNTLDPLRAIYRRAMRRDELAVNPTADIELRARRAGATASPARTRRGGCSVPYPTASDRSGRPPCTPACAAASSGRCALATSTSSVTSSTSAAAGTTTRARSTRSATPAPAPSRSRESSAPSWRRTSSPAAAATTTCSSAARRARRSCPPPSARGRSRPGRPPSSSRSTSMRRATPTPR